MFELFPWNPMLETGIGIVDTQHRRLVELLNRLARMYVGEAEPAAVDAVLDGLTAYAQEHFSTEEGIWAAALPADSPLLHSHEAEHAGFCTRVVAARAELKSAAADLCLTRELLLFLSGWLAEHILQSDRRLALVVQALGRGVSMPEAVAEAHGVLSGGTGLMVHAALDMYRRLSSQTLELLQERQQREANARALVALKTERERQSLAVSLAGMLLVGDADSLPQDLDTLVRRVGEGLAADRCVLRLFSADRQQVHCRAEWCAPGVTASRSLLGVLSADPALEAWSARLREHGEARINDTHDLPDWALLLQPVPSVRCPCDIAAPFSAGWPCTWSDSRVTGPMTRRDGCSCWAAWSAPRCCASVPSSRRGSCSMPCRPAWAPPASVAAACCSATMPSVRCSVRRGRICSAWMWPNCTRRANWRGSNANSPIWPPARPSRC